MKSMIMFFAGVLVIILIIPALLVKQVETGNMSEQMSDSASATDSSSVNSAASALEETNNPVQEESNIPANISPETPVETKKFEENQEDKLKNITVYNHKTKQIMKVDLEDYLKGVVTAEMPALFHIEALRAQAVAARTYIINKQIKDYRPVEHPETALCTNSAHCKAWMSKEEADEKWGADWSGKYWSKICESVDSTQGIIMVYNDEPIVAVFHDMSSGKTENAKDIWGSEIPYLHSVESEGDTFQSKYLSTEEFTVEEFKNKLYSFNNKVKFDDNLMIGEIIFTEAGSVKTIVLGGQIFKGNDIRTIFNLRSTNFTVSISDNKVIFEVKGHGHGVGLSQYGANYAAEKDNMNYQEILKKYYNDIEIVRIK